MHIDHLVYDQSFSPITKKNLEVYIGHYNDTHYQDPLLLQFRLL